MAENTKLRVWHIPQVPMTPFLVDVQTLREAKLVMAALANYDIFQFENNVKPDYANASGLSYYDAALASEMGSEEAGWSDWEDAEMGEGDLLRISDARIAVLDAAANGDYAPKG